MVAINNIQSQGDDQRFKAELVRVIEELQRKVALLESQLNSRSR